MGEKIVILKKSREIPVKRRHPWVFSGAISKVFGDPGYGDVVLVLSYKKEELGYGWYSPRSQIRVRMLSFGMSDEKIDDEFFFKRLHRAYSYRKDVKSLVNSNAYRIVNSEGDFLPGLIIDFYNGYIVCQFLSCGAEKIKHIVLSYLKKQINPDGIYERSDVDVRLKEGLNPVSRTLFGNIPDRIEIQERDVKFYVDIKKGHKTGFYLDQRENRYFLGKISNNKNILNCFCYTGGFGLHALKNRAKKVVNIDTSIDSLEILRENLLLNNIEKSRYEIKRQNVFASLKEYIEAKQLFDIVILDPPKFVKQTSDLKEGIAGYKKLNKRALKIIKPGGYLITFSCSGLVDLQQFKKIIMECGLDCGRDISILKEMCAGVDHPYPPALKYGKYLKGLAIKVE